MHDRAPSFVKSETAPIHLADLNGRHYAFAADVTPPSGGKAVSDDELADVLSNIQLIRQIKEEAGRRITKIDLYGSSKMHWLIYICYGRSDLTDDEQATLTKAQALLTAISRLRYDPMPSKILSWMAWRWITSPILREDEDA